MNFTNKTVVLTGASSGIGYELAKLICSEKCNIVLLSRRKELTDKLAEELKVSGSGVLSLKCDVSVKEEVFSVFNTIKQKFGAIDIAILNSGVSFRNPVEEFSSEKAETTLGVNVLGLVYCFDALLPDFLKRKEGMIVGVSSLADGRGFPKSGLYSGSKAAATLLLESWRIELKKHNIKVLTVKPGFVKTPMTDKNEFKMPFLMSVEKGARIIFTGIKKEKRIIQFPLPTVIGAKLLRIMPDKLFEIIAENLYRLR
ncbi:MAG: SDR family NAD(P)-dependent oxidoreductase [Ignavibacteriaceae bacterium]